MASPQPFELVVQWLYVGMIDEVPDKSPDRHPPYNMFTYIRLWCLCDKARFDMPALQALAMARMADYNRKYAVTFDAPKVEYIYKHTAPFSPLRELVARDAAYEFMRRPAASRLSDGRFGDNSSEYVTENVEFAVDVLYAIRSGLGSTDLRHAFEDPASPVVDADAEVFTDGRSATPTEMKIKMPAPAYGFNGNALGVLTPDPTPNKHSSLKDLGTDDSLDEIPRTPSKSAKGADDGRVLAPVTSCSF